MTIAEASMVISDYRDRHYQELTVDEFQAAGIALVVLLSLDPSERDMIDRLLSQSTPGIN